MRTSRSSNRAVALIATSARHTRSSGALTTPKEKRGIVQPEPAKKKQRLSPNKTAKAGIAQPTTTLVALQDELAKLEATLASVEGEHTKDTEAFAQKLAAVEAEHKGKLAAVEEELKGKLAAVKQEHAEQLAQLETEHAQQRECDINTQRKKAELLHNSVMGSVRQYNYQEREKERAQHNREMEHARTEHAKLQTSKDQSEKDMKHRWVNDIAKLKQQIRQLENAGKKYEEDMKSLRSELAVKTGENEELIRHRISASYAHGCINEQLRNLEATNHQLSHSNETYAADLRRLKEKFDFAASIVHRTYTYESFYKRTSERLLSLVPQ